MRDLRFSIVLTFVDPREPQKVALLTRPFELVFVQYKTRKSLPFFSSKRRIIIFLTEIINVLFSLVRRDLRARTHFILSQNNPTVNFTQSDIDLL